MKGSLTLSHTTTIQKEVSAKALSSSRTPRLCLDQRTTGAEQAELCHPGKRNTHVVYLMNLSLDRQKESNAILYTIIPIAAAAIVISAVVVVVVSTILTIVTVTVRHEYSD